MVGYREGIAVPVTEFAPQFDFGEDIASYGVVDISPLEPVYYGNSRTFILTLSGRVTDNLAIGSLIETNRVHIDTYEAWRSECIDKIEKALQEMYPDRWDVEYSGLDLYNKETIARIVAKKGSPSSIPEGLGIFVSYYIHFPEIEITNSNGELWTILDYYVRLDFDAKLAMVDMEGFRQTKTPIEYALLYTFSHSERSNEGFSGFCYGTTSLDTLVADLSHGTYNDLNIELLLQTLPSYLSWESLEGKPYFSIGELLKRVEGFGGDPPPMPYASIPKIVQDIILNKEPFEFGLTYIGTNIRIAVHTKILPFIKLVTKYTDEHNTYPLDSLRTASIYPAPRMTSEEIEDANRVLSLNEVFTFKGKPICVRVIEGENIEQKEHVVPEKYADLRVVCEVADLLSVKLERFIYEFSNNNFRKKKLPQSRVEGEGKSDN